MIALSDTYFREKDKDSGLNRVLVEGVKTEDYKITTFMEEMGFTDVEFVETYKIKKYDTNNNDSATFIMAYKNVDGKYDTFASVFRGCYSGGEWLSLFNVGDEGIIQR